MPPPGEFGAWSRSLRSGSVGQGGRCSLLLDAGKAPESVAKLWAGGLQVRRHNRAASGSGAGTGRHCMLRTEAARRSVSQPAALPLWLGTAPQSLLTGLQGCMIQGLPTCIMQACCRR